MKKSVRTLLAAALLWAGGAAGAAAAELDGSPGSMRRQHGVAVENGYPILEDAPAVQAAVRTGRLVPVEDAGPLRVQPVRHAVALPEVRLFLQRLAEDYRAATGGTLVVTSLTRPAAEQPPNAHALSVHPAGMAVDLRVPANPHARAWLERTLLALEVEGVLDATRERRPPHYHVAVFPGPYRAYVERLERAEQARAHEQRRESGTDGAVAPGRGEPSEAGGGGSAVVVTGLVLATLLRLRGLAGAGPDPVTRPAPSARGAAPRAAPRSRA